jgi:hypothetical protein
MIDPFIAKVSAGIVAAAFLAIAGVHGYWALGGLWPGHDRDSLSRTVVGGPPRMRGPSSAATWGVAVILVGAAVAVLGTAGLVTVPVEPWLNRAAVLGGAGVLLVRGLEGFLDTRLRPQTPQTVEPLRHAQSPLILSAVPGARTAHVAGGVQVRSTAQAEDHNPLRGNYWDGRAESLQ